MVELCSNCFYEKRSSGVCPACGYDPARDGGKYPLALKPGTILNGRYIIGRVLGQGGFGVTYLAQDYQTKDRVAIKEYLPTDFAGRTQGTYAVQVYSGDRQENFEYGKEQFLAEAKTLAEFIGNDHIVRIYSYFEEFGTAYLAMEYIDGESLDNYMRGHGGRLSTEAADELLIPVMEALDWVHSKGIVHRDIAPDNIIITKDGKAKLIDFGAARYSTGEKSKSLDVILKHGFAPREQYSRHGRQGPFTDVYAIAATYYYAITGKIPPDAIDRIEDDLMIAPSTLGLRISDTGEDALLKALEVSAADRYQRMSEFAAALNASRPPKKKEPVKPKEIVFDQPKPEKKPEPEKPKPEKKAESKKREPAKEAKPEIGPEKKDPPKAKEYYCKKCGMEYSSWQAICFCCDSEYFIEKKEKSQETSVDAGKKEETASKPAEKKKSDKGFTIFFIICALAAVFAALVFSGAFERDWRFDEQTGTLTISYSGNMPDFTGPAFAPWFQYRNSVKTIKIGNRVTRIGNNAFSDYDSLTEIIFSDSLEAIGRSAFQDCDNIKTLQLPDSVTTIAMGAFADCKSLSSVYIPNSVTSLGSYAFEGCTSLANVTSPNNYSYLGIGAFSGCPYNSTGLTDNQSGSTSSTESKKLIGKWLEQQPVHNGNQCPFKVDKTVENCNGLTMDIYVEEVSGFLPYGTWYIYVKTDEDFWHHIAQFSITENMNNKTTSVDLTFYEASTFDYIAICPGTWQAYSAYISADFYYK